MLSAFCLVITLFGCSGSKSNPPQIAAPSSLIYSLSTITAIVGQTISTSIPSVSGSVSAYSIRPALPPGLTLDSITGAISGTPTVAADAASYTIAATNATGSVTATLQITVLTMPPPSDLSYYPSNVTLTGPANLSLSPITPRVTGTVTEYSIAPALPAGLTIDPKSGAIGGYVSGLSPSTVYTVTATNPGGSTTATLTIAIVEPAPTRFSYATREIIGTIGKPIPEDTFFITNYGVNLSFQIDPALPAGLTLNPSTGSISGTPTALSPKTTYIVRATNQGGSATTPISIAVAKSYSSMLDLGHGAHISLMRATATRALTEDDNGHWVLWDLASGKQIKSGDQPLIQYPPASNGPNPEPYFWPIDMAGSVVAVGVLNSVQIYSAVDGSLLTTIVPSGLTLNSTNYLDSSWGLASDGSYIYARSRNQISAWSNAGQLLFSIPGDYIQQTMTNDGYTFLTSVFAGPGQVQVARGPRGYNNIENISVQTGVSSISPAFSENFNSWFADGSRFFANIGNSVSVYSASGVLQATVSLPEVDSLAGMGNWIWTQPSGTVKLYAIGANTPSATYTGAATAFPLPSTLRLRSNNKISLVDLSGTDPLKTDFDNILPYSPTVTVVSPLRYLTGDGYGVVTDFVKGVSAPRIFNHGKAWSIAGSSGRVAIATADGQINLFNPAISLTVSEGTVAYRGSQLQMTSDASVLAATPGPDVAVTSLNFFSLPGGTVINSIPYGSMHPVSATDPRQFGGYDLALSGTAFGQIVAQYQGLTLGIVSPVEGGPATWTNVVTTFGDFLRLSPSGNLVAIGTSVYSGAQVLGTIPDRIVGWLDENRVLANRYVVDPTGLSDPRYLSASIYDTSGTKLSDISVPELLHIQVISSDRFYSPKTNVIYSVGTGQPNWSTNLPSSGVGAIGGSYAVFASGSQVLVDSY